MDRWALSSVIVLVQPIVLGNQQPKKTRLHVFFATWFMTCQSFAGQGKGTDWVGLGWVHE